MTKSLHADLQDFYDVKSFHPNSIKVDTKTGNSQMRSFTILNKRAHAFICEKCQWIKLAKVQSSVLRNPNDYVFNHECNGDDEMHSNTSLSTNYSEERSNSSLPSSSNASMNISESETQESSQFSSSHNSNTDSNLSDSIIDVSMTSQNSVGASSFGSSGQNDSGFRTPDLLDQSSQNQASVIFQCENHFSHTSESLNMKVTIKCQFKSEIASDLTNHKAKCALRYKAKMAKSNPGYLSKVLWSFTKELRVSDYMGKFSI